MREGLDEMLGEIIALIVMFGSLARREAYLPKSDTLLVMEDMIRGFKKELKKIRRRLRELSIKKVMLFDRPWYLLFKL